MKLIIFDLEVAGHHPGYLRYLLRYWPDANTHLHFVVSPAFGVRHGDVVQTECRAHVTWEPVTEEELTLYEASKRSLLRRTWVEWQLYCQYAKKSQADQGLILYLDRFQLPLALRLALPCQTSGIFFRPKFHYREFRGHRPTRKERLHTLREQWLWRSALRHPQLKTVFSLDALAVEPLHALGGSSTVVHLPDPVEIYPVPVVEVKTVRQALGIEPARKIFLLFGMIDRRKGIYQVLEALQQLPPTQQAQITLLLVGVLAEADRAKVLAMIHTLRHASSVQVVLHDQFVPEAQIPLYFAVADVVLALYQHHVGSSGILLQAAAAGKPVLASDYGLMGELVRRHGLGFTVESTQASESAKSVTAFLSGGPSAEYNRQAAMLFAHENSAEEFARVVWDKLVRNNSV